MEKIHREMGYVTSEGHWQPYADGILATFQETLTATEPLFTEVCRTEEEPVTRFFLVHHKTQTYNDAPKFKTLEAAVAAAIMMGVPE